MPELLFFRRGEEVLRFLVDRPRTVLGRGESSDVVIPDPAVSRSHAALVWDGQRMLLEDLSGKGTMVSGAPIAKAPLVDGADISLGQWSAVFRERGSSDPSDAATDAGGTMTEARPAEARLAIQLRIRQGGTETVQRFSGDTLAIGSDPGSDVMITGRFVSARHAKLQRKDNVVRIVDQGSKNGTFIGQVRVFEAEVPMMTSIRIGEAELVVESLSTRKEHAFQGIIGADPAIRQLAELVDRVAPSSAAVAILGESGTGKELVANAIHARSARADKPFIPVNCAAISPDLIESELFGHEKGAFTGALNTRKGAFEEAEGGTIFLDEIGELPLELQAKLLRALESGEIKRVGAPRPMTVDVRIVAATNRDLLSLCREGKFREDLYYRLCVVPLHLPPLRNRKADIAALADHFLRMFSPKGQLVRLTPSASERLLVHRWPGNIRELRNVIHRGLLLRRGPVVDADDLTFDEEVNQETGVVVPELPPGMTLEQMLEKLERQIVESALRRYRGNKERVAKELGVARSTLFKRLKDWGLTNKDDPDPLP